MSNIGIVGSRIVVAVVALLASAGVAAAGNSPRVNYMLHCMGCHLEDGSGKRDAVPGMRGVVGRFPHTREGRRYLVQVPGVSQSSLPDDELAELVNWLLHEFSAEELPAGFVPYGAAEIGELRRTKLVDVTATRTRLLEGADTH